MFTLSRSRCGEYFVPRLIKVSGISEGTWECTRSVWYGDCDRERVPPRKKLKTKHDGGGNLDVGDEEESVVEDGPTASVAAEGV